MDYLLGIDAGTTSFKALLIDEKGETEAFSKKTYALTTYNDTYVEYSVEGYWELLKATVAELIQKAEVDVSKIKALSIACQSETLICLDGKGRPLRDAIVWLDNRASQSAASIKKEFGQKAIYEKTGQIEISATWPASKILWLRDNQKSVFEKTEKYLLLEDYLLYRLTGRFVSEKTLLSSSLYLDITKGIWWQDMLDFIGVSAQQLPEIKGSAENIGELSEEASRELGLDKGTCVVTGSLDQAASMIGAGSLTGEAVCETTGTSMSVCINSKHIPAYKLSGNMPCHISPVDGQYFLIMWSQAAGMVFDWFKNNFCEHFTYEEINDEIKTVSAASEGLLMIPHISGVAFPDFDPNPKGVFYGIRPLHERRHFLKAIMESIAYMLREHIEKAERAGFTIKEIHSLGGAARSDVWNQIKSDILGMPIKTLSTPETTCLGACIMAGKGIGLFESLIKAGQIVAKQDRIYFPAQSVKFNYDRAFNAYKKLNECLKSFFGEY